MWSSYCFQNTDRFYIRGTRSAALLGSYGLAWTLVQGAMLMLSSFNLISTVRIGEAISLNETERNSIMRRQIWLTMLAAGVALLALIPAAWLSITRSIATTADSFCS